MKHELHVAVDDAFRQKGIEIAFPQQDIFIKNLSDLSSSGGGDEHSPKSPSDEPKSPSATGRGGPTRRAGPSSMDEWELGDDADDREPSRDDQTGDKRVA